MIEGGNIAGGGQWEANQKLSVEGGREAKITLQGR